MAACGPCVSITNSQMRHLSGWWKSPFGGIVCATAKLSQIPTLSLITANSKRVNRSRSELMKMQSFLFASKKLPC